MNGTVYLIHFSEKLSNAQHYIGWTTNLKKRFRHHQKGSGAKILAALVKRKISFHVIRIWESQDRNFERKLKNQKNAKRLCPICKKEKTK